MNARTLHKPWMPLEGGGIAANKAPTIDTPYTFCRKSKQKYARPSIVQDCAGMAYY
jgi:hypothetical protein